MPSSTAIASYNHADLPEVQQFISDMNVFGIRVLTDEELIGAGEDWRDAYQTALQTHADSMCLVLIGRSGEGDSQRAEIRYLEEERKGSLVYVLLPGGNPEDLKKIGPSGRNFVDLREEIPGARSRLIKLARKILGESFWSSDEQHAIFQPVDRIANSVYISAPAGERAWEDLAERLEEGQYRVLRDPDARPDALSTENRLSVLSSSVVVVDGRLDPSTGNLRADAAYTLGLARMSCKPIVLIVDKEDDIDDWTSISACIVCDRLEDESEELLQTIRATIDKLEYPFLTANREEVLSLTFDQLAICPRLRVDVLQLVENYQRQWNELELVSCGLNLLRGVVHVALKMEIELDSNPALTQAIAKSFRDLFDSDVKGVFKAVKELARDQNRHKSEAKQLLSRIGERIASDDKSKLSKAEKFLGLYYTQLGYMSSNHQTFFAKFEDENNQDNFGGGGPKSLYGNAIIQLEIVDEARKSLEQMFVNLLALLSPTREEIKS